MDHITFDCSIRSTPLQIDAPYYNAIKDTTVCFLQENISVFVNSLGHIEFFDTEKCSLGFVDFPVHKDPSEYGHTAQYGTIKCISDGNTITFFLPVYYWTDSYPHCDGESDRWSRHISSWFRVVFDCSTQQISILDLKG